jgi:hypothetical protein|tara:strand:- start:6872 stop:6985 length:114 start_codon:yes stop_codon:yes gene_type:complete
VSLGEQMKDHFACIIGWRAVRGMDPDMMALRGFTNFI